MSKNSGQGKGAPGSAQEHIHPRRSQERDLRHQKKKEGIRPTVDLGQRSLKGFAERVGIYLFVPSKGHGDETPGWENPGLLPVFIKRYRGGKMPQACDRLIVQ